MSNPAPEIKIFRPTEREMYGLVAEISQQMDILMRKIADELDLTASQVIALRELGEPLTLKQLAQRMHCEPSNATFVAARLEKQGFLARIPHLVDRRAKLLKLTEEGENKRYQVLLQLVKESLLGALSEEEQVQLCDLLRRVATK